MTWWIIVAFAVSACSITLAKSHMMIPYRRLMGKMRLGNLARCHYCTSHWLSMAVVAAYQPSVGAGFWPDLIVAWLAIVGLAALISGVIMYFTVFSSEE
jgi:hypothetical protein